MFTAIGKTTSGLIALSMLFIANQGLANDQAGDQEAAKDLNIIVEGKCEAFNYDRYVITNTNTSKRILVNVITNGNLQSHNYLDKNGVVQQDRYPKNRKFLLMPTKPQMIGCAIANWKEFMIIQTFSFDNPQYVPSDFILPDKDEAADFFRIYQIKDVGNAGGCDQVGEKFAVFANAHPFKAIEGCVESKISGSLDYVELPAMATKPGRCLSNPPDFFLQAASFPPNKPNCHNKNK
jgi:hypothetical protein